MIPWTATDPVFRSVDEVVLPEQSQTELLGIEAQIHFLRVTDRDGARTHAFDEIAVDDRFVFRLQDNRGAVQAQGNSGLRAILQVQPHGVHLSWSARVEHVTNCGIAERPRSRHARTGPINLRVFHVSEPPVLPQTLRHRREVDGLNSGGRMRTKRVTLDAAEAFRTDQSPASRLQMCGLRIVVDDFRFGLEIQLAKCGRQVSGVGLAEFRHPGQHVRSVVGAVGEDSRQPFFGELVPDAVQSWRQSAFVTHFLHRRPKERAAGFANAAQLVPLMTRITVEPGEGFMNNLVGITPGIVRQRRDRLS